MKYIVFYLLYCYELAFLDCHLAFWDRAPCIRGDDAIFIPLVNLSNECRRPAQYHVCNSMHKVEGDEITYSVAFVTICSSLVLQVCLLFVGLCIARTVGISIK